jgi:hypothetical protein
MLMMNYDLARHMYVEGLKEIGKQALDVQKE